MHTGDKDMKNKPAVLAFALLSLIAAGCSPESKKKPEITDIAIAETQEETNPDDIVELLSQTLDQQSDYTVKSFAYTSGSEEKTIKVASCRGCHWKCENCEPTN